MGFDGCCALTDDASDLFDSVCPYLLLEGGRFSLDDDLRACKGPKDPSGPSADRQLNILDQVELRR